ncbi:MULTISPECIES: 3-hexulose-6-phosphate synthase [Aerococcus]|uniref:3-hexulose-6-phosphate synthase n=1 Tax=Aerococcus mictus TaxID=2976810 RepID=A0A1E9PKE4_9LACT|nr:MULTISPECIES: 3-hexulose-6-phosphate synthase [Aerococcus]AEA00955.1 3-hexulose-6-phosphate synthase [Aerococcus sp. Group 1]KAA9290633.1 3-hexulose-6-phosphate synthase [Aerococcus mictus]MBU5610913.1 3-hexulose-6-phosphate synthase [Aerococcus urinae]MCY3031484.1 3-hexulose-6-phosphate synthase [Aerococcus sp. Group 1]MCY3039787.1 3-hexulose-6-phosphate synthase [Aerococcus sp. Group 2]
MTAKLQLALDDISLEKGLELVKQVKDYIDIVEIGTPFMMEYGMEAVRQVKAAVPEVEVLCDAKIMDAGYLEAKETFDAGADYVTVLGVTDNLTIKDVVKAAKEANAKVMVDMITITDIAKRVAEVEELGVDVVAVHTGVDAQAAGRTPLEDLAEMSKHVDNTVTAVAGGIKVDTVADYMQYNPQIIIVGGGILHADDPVQAAKELKEQMEA